MVLYIEKNNGISICNGLVYKKNTIKLNITLNFSQREQ